MVSNDPSRVFFMIRRLVYFITIYCEWKASKSVWESRQIWYRRIKPTAYMLITYCMSRRNKSSCSEELCCLLINYSVYVCTFCLGFQFIYVHKNLSCLCCGTCLKLKKKCLASLSIGHVLRVNNAAKLARQIWIDDVLLQATVMSERLWLTEPKELQCSSNLPQ